MTPEQEIIAAKLIVGRDEETEALIIEDQYNQTKAITLAGQILVAQRQADLDIIRMLVAEIKSEDSDYLQRKFAVLSYLALTNRAIK